MQTYKLGKHLATYSPFTLKLKTYLLPSTLPPLPKAADWTAPVPAASVGLLLNGPNLYAPAKAPNGVGCCVVAAMLNKRQNDSAASGNIKIATDADCLGIYMAKGGYVPGDDSTDRGLNLLDFMTTWRDVGYTLADGSISKIGGFVSISLDDPDERKMALHLSGSVISGVMLPESAEDQFQAGEPYTVVKGSPIAGGHCILHVAYDENDQLENWQRLKQPATPAWTAKYLDECYGVFDTDDWVKNNNCPSGIDGDHFLADMQQLGS